MKSLARLHVWWPGIDTEIETLVRNCSACQGIRNHQPPTTSHPWVWPSQPWQRIHLDFTGPFWGHMYLLVVDAHSKWIEVVMMTSTTIEKTITELCKLFASFGLPEQVISDNSSQFTSSEFNTFMKSRFTVVSREAKKKQHACASSGPRDHYSELFTRMAALKF